MNEPQAAIIISRYVHAGDLSVQIQRCLALITFHRSSKNFIAAFRTKITCLHAVVTVAMGNVNGTDAAIKTARRN